MLHKTICQEATKFNLKSNKALPAWEANLIVIWNIWGTESRPSKSCSVYGCWSVIKNVSLQPLMKLIRAWVQTAPAIGKYMWNFVSDGADLSTSRHFSLTYHETNKTIEANHELVNLQTSVIMLVRAYRYCIIGKTAEIA